MVLVLTNSCWLILKTHIFYMSARFRNLPHPAVNTPGSHSAFLAFHKVELQLHREKGLWNND